MRHRALVHVEPANDRRRKRTARRRLTLPRDLDQVDDAGGDVVTSQEPLFVLKVVGQAQTHRVVHGVARPHVRRISIDRQRSEQRCQRLVGRRRVVGVRAACSCRPFRVRRLREAHHAAARLPMSTAERRSSQPPRRAHDRGLVRHLRRVKEDVHVATWRAQPPRWVERRMPRYRRVQTALERVAARDRTPTIGEAPEVPHQVMQLQLASQTLAHDADSTAGEMTPKRDRLHPKVPQKSGDGQKRRRSGARCAQSKHAAQIELHVGEGRTRRQ